MWTHGFGMSSVRFICGTQDIHKTLEKKIAEFYGLEDTICMPLPLMLMVVF
jgi:glycine C-acetyltransferase